jgi:hypothetical protein
MPASRALCAAPRHVYAGIISNKTSKPVLCTIYYTTGTSNNNNKDTIESISVTLDAGGRACIPEREYQPMPEATFTCRKVVSRIEIDGNDKTIALDQPFIGVICPVTEWRFDIHDDHIASVNPSAATTPTKTDNPIITS